MSNDPNVHEATVHSLEPKSGWLFNQERVLCCLKQWKRRWFVLDTDCTLRYFQRPQSSVAYGFIVLRKPYTVVDSSKLENIDPPQGCSKECLFKIKTADDRLTLCSENPEEMRAWKDAFESIRGVCTTPLPTIHELHILRPVIYLQATATPIYVVQNADNQPTTVICQAEQTQVRYQLAKPMILTPVLVRPF